MATIKDVAELAEVSVGTVSNILNNKTKVSKEKQKAVLKAIEELDYSPLHSARQLRKKETNTIAFIIPNIKNPIFSEMTEAIANQARTNGYDTIIYKGSATEDIEQGYTNLIKQNKVDGIIIGGSTHIEKPLVSKISKTEFPAVILERNEENVTTVEIDNFSGGLTAAEFLVSNNHQQIAYAHLETPNVYLDRVSGFVKGLEKNNINPLKMPAEDTSFTSGYELMKQLLDYDIEAVFFPSDIMSFGALNLLYEKNIEVPEQISVIGYDGITMGNYSSPALTTIEQPVQKLAEKSISTLIEIINGEDILSHIKLKPSILPRESVARK